MAIRCLNCMTCNARIPARLHTGALCLLVDTRQGLVLVDTGLGCEDYTCEPTILRVFRIATRVPMDPRETAISRITHLGYRVQDVRHIVLTHMHFDHCGGLLDFPEAKVHVHRREYEAFMGRPRRMLDLAYVRRHVARRPTWVLHGDACEHWFDFAATPLPFEPAMYLVPLFGHTRGHCGVVIETPQGWHFHVGDAAPSGFNDNEMPWFARLVLGPHIPRLLAFRAAHPDVRMTTGHMPLDFFDEEIL